MPRYIDAERLWKAITTRIEEYCDITDLIEIIETQPTVDIDAITESHERTGYDRGFRDGYAQATSEVRHGRWIDDKIAFYNQCSECGANVRASLYEVFLDCDIRDLRYCPNCGAKMDEVNKDE